MAQTEIPVETLEQIAESIAVRSLPYSAFKDGEDYTQAKAILIAAVLSALRNERERAAKVAETAFAEFHTGHNAGKWIARAIREGR